MNKENFLKMQEDWYTNSANEGQFEEGKCISDRVVGNFSAHEQFQYEDYLLKYYKPCFNDAILEYGCGPGRQMKRMQQFVGRVDGCDISQKNLDNAKIYLGEDYDGNLFKTNGDSIPTENKYEMIYSVICFQHIPVYQVRRSIIENMFERLNDGGFITIQMAIGPSTIGQPTFGYYENNFQATETNGGMDCRVDHPDELCKDFAEVGLKDITYVITDPVCDHHAKWIWATGKKM